MATQTLLQITQDILSAMDSDNVSSISDTIEATQVAQIVKSTYFDIMTTRDYASKQTTFQLEGLGDTNHPTRMRIPVNISTVVSVKYNKIKSGATARSIQEVQYKTPQEFLDIVDLRVSTESNIQSVTEATGIILHIINNAAPTYWTSFDDEYITMDSFDNAVDSTLQTSKTSCIGIEDPADVALADALVFDLPAKLFPLLLAEAKSACFMQLKQLPNPKAEQSAKALRSKFQVEHSRINKARWLTDTNVYGRK